MSKYKTLTKCCGKHTFEPGDTIELDKAEADELIAGGAIVAVEETKPKRSRGKKSNVDESDDSAE